MKKMVCILLGIFFGVWAIAVVVGGLIRERGELNLSPWGLTNVASLVAASGMLALFSIWFFQSDFKKPPDKTDAK